MALNFPLSLSDFFGGFRVAECELYAPQQYRESQTAAGEVIRGRVGPSLWAGRVYLTPAYHRDARAVAARLMVATYPNASALLGDPSYDGPAADPNGAALGAATPKIAAVAQNNRDLTISGLPVGYRLSAGDYLSFRYGPGSALYAFHQLVSGGAAASNGRVAVEVTPHIRPGWASGAAVELVEPVFKAVLRSATAGRIGPLATAGHSFEFIQTLR